MLEIRVSCSYVQALRAWRSSALCADAEVVEKDLVESE